MNAIVRLHEHRMWVNGKLLEAARGLSSDQLNRSFAIGQGTLFSTLTHLFAAEYVWLAALEGDESPLTPGDVPGKLPGNQLGPNAMTSIRELEARWSELNRRWMSYLDQLQPDELLNDVIKRNSVTDIRYATPRRDVLLHVCTHAQYTVAQAINMMRHLGVEALPDPMLISLVREERGV